MNHIDNDQKAIGDLASRALSTISSSATRTAISPIDQPRLNDTQLAELRVIADTQLPTLPSVETNHFAKSMRVLEATLPRRESDPISGKLVSAAYFRKFAHLPREQVDYAMNRALEECRWFPTIAELLDLTKGWERRDAQLRATARARIQRELQDRFDDIMMALRRRELTQNQINELPKRWKWIAWEQGSLRRDGDHFILRPLDD